MISHLDEDKELLINDSIREDSITSLESSSMSITLYSHLSNFERHPTYTHVCQVVALITLATIINIFFPFYLTTVNERSDVYVSLLFTSICCVVILFLIFICLKLQNRDRCLFPPIFSMVTLWKLGTYLGISCLLIYYSRDRNRVKCYLQDPLAAVSLPLAVVFHFLRSRKVDSTRKLLCIAASIIGLFICIDFQIWDEYTCHGHPNDDSPDVKSWSFQEHSVWTIVYIAGLALFAYFLTLLDREIKTCKPECHIATIALAHSSPHTNELSDDVNMVLLPQETSSEYKLIPNYHIWTLAFWLHFWAMCTTLLFLWTDLFPFLGKAGPDLKKFMFEGFLCHFSISESCANVFMFSWPFIIAVILLSVCLLSLMINSHTCSVPYIMAILMTALPTSSLFWSFFQSDGMWHWNPNFTGETGFALVGLPVLIASLMFYRHYAKMESQIA